MAVQSVIYTKHIQDQSFTYSLHNTLGILTLLQVPGITTKEVIILSLLMGDYPKVFDLCTYLTHREVSTSYSIQQELFTSSTHQKKNKAFTDTQARLEHLARLARLARLFQYDHYSHHAIGHHHFHTIFSKSTDQNFDCLTSKTRLFLLEKQQWKIAEQKALKIIEHCHQLDIKMTHYLADDYPLLLRMMPSPPPIIYYQGRLPPHPCIAIVGTRTPHSWSIASTEDCTRLAIHQNFGIVSGLALGIDTHAHKSSLDQQGYTLAVLAGGLDCITPKSNRLLASSILEKGGALLSEYPPQTPIKTHMFVSRNRLQSALSIATVIIQSPLKGGSMHTARFTLDQRRHLAIPYCPPGVLQVCKQGNYLFDGTQALLYSPWPQCRLDIPALKDLSLASQNYYTLNKHQQVLAENLQDHQSFVSALQRYHLSYRDLSHKAYQLYHELKKFKDEFIM